MRRRAICVVMALCALLLLSCDVLAALPALRAPVKVWILTYHSVSDNPEDWGRFVVSPEEFEADLRFLRDNGYQTVLTGDLVAYVTQGTPLPDKPVMLTLDDGYRNNYTVVLPLLEKYKMRAVVSLIGELIDRADPGNEARGMMVWPEARALADSEWAELGNHTYGLHHSTQERNGCARRRKEPLREYQAMLAEDVGRAQEVILAQTGTRPAAFCYPYGATCSESGSVLRRLGFSVTFTTRTGSNVLTGDRDCLYGLRRNSRAHGVSIEEILK